MELKRIIARDSRSANEKAIQLYGPDVLIISSQRVDQQTELIVAVDISPEPLQPMPCLPAAAAEHSATSAVDALAFKADAEAPVPFSEVFQSASGQLAAPPTLASKLDAAAQSDTSALGADPFNDAVAQNFAPASAPAQVPAASDAPRSVARAQPLGAHFPNSFAENFAEQAVQHGAHPGAQHGLSQSAHQIAQNLAPSAAQTLVYEQQRSHEIVDMLRQEMVALRKEFALSRQMQPWQQTLGLSPAVQQLSMAMQEVGMPVALRALLTDSIQELQNLEEAWPVVQRLLGDALDRAAMAAPQTGVHALCGPTGAGKTSMLGRLAYVAGQAHGADQQVMISYGEQRPGAWSQLQLLASQAGASCFRAADLAMLNALVDELHGKTLWIDTPGTHFGHHAQQLLKAHPSLQVHAVLPVDATVTSVQKILQNQEIRWSSLMLTKLDEAAYPWPLIKGLCELKLPVSCMAEDSKINLPPLAFDAQRLVAMAMTPLQALLPQVQHLDATPPKAVRKPRAQKAALSIPEVHPKTRPVRARSGAASSASKAAHG